MDSSPALSRQECASETVNSHPNIGMKLSERRRPTPQSSNTASVNDYSSPHRSSPGLRVAKDLTEGALLGLVLHLIALIAAALVQRIDTFYPVIQGMFI